MNNKEYVRIICKAFKVPLNMVNCNPLITELEAKIVQQLDGHFCNDWDGMAVSAWTYEYDCCVDFKKTLRGRIVNWFVMWKFDWQAARAQARRDFDEQ